MNITVLIPTYRRPNELVRCWEALHKQQKQTLLADDVLLVVRDTNAETWNTHHSRFFTMVARLRSLPSEGALARQKLLASLRGRWQGWRTWQESRFGKGIRSLLNLKNKKESLP